MARRKRAVAFPDFERIRCTVSDCNAQFYQQGNLCSILLSYADLFSNSRRILSDRAALGNPPPPDSARPSLLRNDLQGDCHRGIV